MRASNGNRSLAFAEWHLITMNNKAIRLVAIFHVIGGWEIDLRSSLLRLGIVQTGLTLLSA